jgi:glycosyltransferase involved in cell wall biosynthesis
MAPLVSFIVAARDAEQTIESALRSLQWQTVGDWEAVVVDDGSRDATAQRVRALRDPRIRLVELGDPQGRSSARNEAIALAGGRYVAIQDADDVSHPRRLELLLDLIASGSGCGVASGQHAEFQCDGAYWTSMRWPTAGDEIRAGLLLGRMTVCHPSSLIDADLVRQLGGYDEACVRSQDLNLFIRAATTTRFAASDRIVLYYRHPRVVAPRYWLESQRYREIAVRRAATGVHPSELNGRSSRPRPGWRSRALLSYARYAAREHLVRATPVPGPDMGTEAPVNRWAR